MERKVEINLLFFKITFTFPPPSKHRPDPLSRSADHNLKHFNNNDILRAASDWEFYKMKSQTRKTGRSFTKSHLMLDLIANLENIDNSEEDKEEEEEEEVYTELEEEEQCREELQEKYSQIVPAEVRC